MAIEYSFVNRGERQTLTTQTNYTNWEEVLEWFLSNHAEFIQQFHVIINDIFIDN